MALEEHDIEGICKRLRRRFRDWPACDVEDAIQEGLLAMVRSERRGEAEPEPIAFCSAVVRRRLLDRLRQSRPIFGLDLDALARNETPTATDWASILEQAGLEPTAGWREVLDCIAGGVRTSQRMAEILRRDTSSIRERRERFCRWLAQHRNAPPPAKRLMLWQRRVAAINQEEVCDADPGFGVLFRQRGHVPRCP